MILYFWLVIFFIAQILSGMPGQMLNSAWPTMYKVVNAPETNLAILQGAFLLVTTFSLAFSAILKKKIGARNLCGIGLLLLGIGIAMYSVSTKFSICIIASSIIGLSCGFVDMISNFYLTMYYSKTLHAWMNCCWGLGSSLGAFIVSIVLARGYDYRVAFKIVIPVIFVLALVIFIVRYFDDKKRTDYLNKQDSSYDKKDDHIYSEVFKKKNILLYFMCLFMANFMLHTNCTWLPTYSVNMHRVDIAVAASFVSILFGTLAICRFFSGIIVKFFNAKIILLICLVLYTIGSLILLIARDNIHLYYLACIIMGVGISPQYPLMISLSKEFFGEKNLDAIIGMATSFAQIGGFAGTTITGIIVNIFGFNSYLFVGVLAGILAITIFNLLKRRAK